MERETQKKLKQIVEEEKKNENVVKIGHQKITIEESEYKWTMRERK